MKQVFIISALIISLMGCASTKDTKQTTETIDQSNSIALHEEAVPGANKPEVRKVKIAQPGISPNTILNGVADVLVDGSLESDSLKKKNTIHVLIDDAVEKTGEMEDTEKDQFNTIKMPK
jgi:hypothetical protein